MRDAARARSRLALLRIGTAGVVLDQSEVLGVEARHDVRPGAEDGVERIEFGAAQRPVFALDGALAPIALDQATGRVCAMLGSGDAVYGLLCDELEILGDAEVSGHPLPAAMRWPGTPVLGLVRARERLAVRSSARELARHLGVQRTLE